MGSPLETGPAAGRMAAASIWFLRTAAECVLGGRRGRTGGGLETGGRVLEEADKTRRTFDHRRPQSRATEPKRDTQAMLLRVGLARGTRFRGAAASLPLARLRRGLSSEPPPPPEWTDTVDYLDESGELLSSAPGARPAVPGADPTILSGASAHPYPRPAAAARIASLALRHRSGAPLSAALSALPSPPDPPLLLLAASSLPGSDPIPLISLIAWARLQPWFVPSDDLSRPPRLAPPTRHPLLRTPRPLRRHPCAP
ncbi:hypothetical protein PR202_ga19076 [Eleusine coracana subsp. coracana]|uniref:Uncharacterized protein n=1 Tax=Eleusine coracana subsp. coracana TaxID=191504 RepID=A0AAV5CVG4_ELECO|nr:hypothetical protein PR202_ga19076 [Eleusine coracana subsp. coracana]